MKRVYICSRYRADERHTQQQNIQRALFACGYALDHDCAPYAPHLVYPRVLDDDDEVDRARGLAAAELWLPVCDEIWQWGATVSEGMAAELKLAEKLGLPVRVFNSIGIPKERWNGEKWRNEVEGCDLTDESQ